MDNRFTRDQHVKCFAHIIHLAANEAIKPVANTVNAVRHVLAAGIVLKIVVKKSIGRYAHWWFLSVHL